MDKVARRSGDITAVAGHIREKLAATPTGVETMSRMAAAVRKLSGCTVGTARNQIRRVVADTGNDVVELSSGGDWGVLLADDGTRQVWAWISPSYSPAEGDIRFRIVFSRDDVGSGPGSGRETWITTRAVVDAALAGRRAALKEQQQAERARQREDAERYRAEALARWVEAEQRDRDYVALLRHLHDAVPGIEIRVLPHRHTDDGILVMMEVGAECAAAFKQVLNQAFPAATSD